MVERANHKLSGEIARLDPRALIFESYRIAGISPEECRVIFLDWALGASDEDLRPRVLGLLDHYKAQFPDHPMTQVLQGALAEAPAAKRRGGRAGRLQS